MEHRYSGSLTWPLFVEMSNTCLDPHNPDLTACLEPCLLGHKDTDNVACQESIEGYCGAKIMKCFDEVVENFEESDEVPKLKYPPLYASIVNIDDPDRNCCNPDYVRVNIDDIDQAASVLEHCGYVFLPGMVPREIATNALAAVHDHLGDVETFHNGYVDNQLSDYVEQAIVNDEGEHRPMTPEEIDEADEWHAEQMEFLFDWHRQQVFGQLDEGGYDEEDDEDMDDHWCNLRSGRFEIPLPEGANPLLEYVRDSSLMQLLSQVWDGDQPTFLYSQALVQTAKSLTGDGEGQDLHRDSGSTEDMKVQVAIHDYTSKDGGTAIQPGTHTGPDFVVPYDNLFEDGILVDLVQAPQEDLCLGFAADEVKAGDVLAYYAPTLHGGMPNIAGQLRRVFVDMSFHSANNFHLDSEREHENYFSANLDIIGKSCAWHGGTPQYTTEMHQRTCKVMNNVVSRLKAQRKLMNGSDESTCDDENDSN